MKHTVHIMATVRVTVRNVEANSHKEACEKAYETTDLSFLSGHAHDGTEYDYAEEITAMHVDEVGDEDYNNSTWHGMDNELLSGTAVLRWIEPGKT